MDQPPAIPATEEEDEEEEVPQEQPAVPAADGAPQFDAVKKRKRVPWTDHEEAALKRGFAKYGALPTRWKNMLEDTELGVTLKVRLAFL